MTFAHEKKNLRLGPNGLRHMPKHDTTEYKDGRANLFPGDGKEVNRLFQVDLPASLH